ncbi:hypothetical protein [Zooshikella harenae]|uniref:Uncharacterized protein n=1 Tax=Zooshikella harenae TaxID=2827238 RepID=A0ABS5ZGR6_9GAMM|nr:hypothetical protein [Zooshikella harenae]MBU2713170.1 hypothetical protein [Zooshikella harenae]
MSHIDSFKHELVGLFGGLPIYHPLEEINGDFQCNQHQLMLGGGSGEHPALIIKNPLAAVAWFIMDELDSLEDDSIDARDYPLKQHCEKWKDTVRNSINWEYEANLYFCEWTVSTYKNFYDICVSPAMVNPFSEDADKSFEEWLILGFGEFIFFAMPELAASIMEKLDSPYKYFHHMTYNNILVVPKNFPVYANGGNAFKFT